MQDYGGMGLRVARQTHAQQSRDPCAFDPLALRVISKPCLHHDVLYHRLGRSKTASKIEGVASRKPWYVMA
jgi:hypothetical protein